jgi:hypothetical protein
MLTTKKEISGYCEWDGNGVEETQIQLYQPNEEGFEFSWHSSGDFNDYSNRWEDYMEVTGGKLYLTLKDYKKDKFVDLNEWKNV